jgi:hypothetical protein
MALLLQPKRHPPAIQIDTLTDKSKRSAFVERYGRISDVQSTPELLVLSRIQVVFAAES